ncbi:hypothetical protein [Psychrobium sp. 1_MG-2023]|uniref:hypothetical protein n=1 Tax=Psychrobium sp. 1_MG-2023 TaxID=3062624 RepID=UPI000C34FA33|nr:hypothetical protein [Psychrobium sp. 1_MG-2023]MDP2560555.1 hypothetical protein [Psychrobium sp. 1_MG-2023]PKF57545.1 hypothetical protein CW748_06535 [Alteromonadales bacterium alter-6D02]
MRDLNRSIILLLYIAVAVACYLFGTVSGVMVFIMLGVGLELAFGLGLFGRQGSGDQKTQ